MQRKRGTPIGQLILASLGFVTAFAMWFALAPFSAGIIQEYNLQKKDIALIASSTIWLAPIFRQFIGIFTDKLGAPKMAGFVLFYTGIFSILASFSRNYSELFITRLIVASAGIFFVVGIQHVAQWFDEHEMGLAEGIYAGTGNAGAGLAALFLPRIYGLDYRTAWLHLGIFAIALAIVYVVFGVAAKDQARAERAKKSATLKDTVYVWTRFAAIALMFQYAMTFGLEIAMNAWLPSYYTTAFGDTLKSLGYADLKALTVAAGTLASVQSFQASLWRPFSGMVSDLFLKNKWTPWPFLAKDDPIAPRIHWAFTSMIGVTIVMFLFTLAGLSGNLVLSVATLALLGFVISWGTGANFALTPVLFQKCPGIATGFIGGICTVGGIVYPLIYGKMANIHMGYAAVAAFLFIPFMLLFITAFRAGKKIDVDAGIGSCRTYGVSQIGSGLKEAA